MTITEKFDLAIKLLKTGRLDGEYVLVHEGKEVRRATYMTNDEWLRYEADMPEMIRESFMKGDGGELTPKDGYPPKMACYGSSSRLIYELSRDKAGFGFEMKLPTTVGGVANLDGYIDNGDGHVFVEAKCHEPYTAKKTKVSVRYCELYEYISSKMAGVFEIATSPTNDERQCTAEYFARGERIARFDIKQMICHMLGIATGLLSGSIAKKNISFIYLLYDPAALELKPAAKARIAQIYERTCYESKLIDFGTLFEVILSFLAEKKGAAQNPECKLAFTLVSQKDYKEHI